MNGQHLTRFRSLAVALLFTAIPFIIASCGGDDDDDTSPEKAGSNSPAADNGSSGSAASGTFVIDGKKFDAVEVRRCEPFGGISGNDAHEDDLDVAARSKSGEYINVVISNNPGYGANREQFTQQFHELRLSRTGDKGTEQFEASASNNRENVWYAGSKIFPYSDAPADGSEPLISAPFALDGKNLSGEMKITQDWPEGATGVVSVSFNLKVPDKVGKC